MNIDLVKESIKINEVAELCSSEVLAEGDVIVPDSCPDVASILQIEAHAVINSREIQTDKIVLGGEVHFNILYVPEEAPDNTPAKSLRHILSFTDVCEARGLSNDTNLKCSADVTHIENSVVNSRKLNLKSVIEIEIKACTQRETELVCDVVSDEDLLTRKKTVNAYSPTVDEEFTVVIPDKLEVPSGKPPITEILKVDASVTGHDVKIVTGKAIIQGVIKVCTLYTCGEPSGPIQFMEHEIPFTEILDMPDAVEGMDCEIEYNITSIYYEADYDDDDCGARVMGVEITMTVSVCAASTATIEVLDDCYSPDYDVELTKKECTIENVLSHNKSQIPAKGIVTLTEECPDISQVYNVVAKPYVNDVSADGDSTVVSGVLDVYILYLTVDPQVPLYSFKQEIPFTYTEETGSGDKVSVECATSLSNLSYNLTGEKSVEIRANIAISLKLITSHNIEVIESITASETAKQDRASIVICFVQRGDTLWDIAKRYKTTIEKIALANQLSEDANIEGGKLLIPKA